MFFYRSWLNAGGKSFQSDHFTSLQTPFEFAKWIYLALLIATVLTCCGLNFAFLISFIQNGLGGFRKAPNIVFLCMAIRDLIVCTILIPICIDWYVIENVKFTGGFILCKFTGFLDFWMLAEYPILIIVFGIILLTRKFPKPEDEFFDEPPLHMDEMLDHQSTRSSNVRSVSRNSYRGGGGVPVFNPNVSSTPSKPPSVVGSVDGYRAGHGGNPYRPQRQIMNPHHGAARPGSVTGSIEGRLANSRGGRRTQQQVPFMASSPLPEVDEDVGDALDLWEAASLDYPGREIDEPNGWEFMEEHVSFEEPHYHTWHLWLAGLTWAIALSVGVPAAMMVTHKTDPGPDLHNGHVHVEPSRPGCYVDVNPFKNPQFITINDPGFNFNLSVVILFYIVAAAAMVLLLILVNCRKTKNSKYQRYVKIFTWYCIIFTISRSPIDIWQLKALIETAMGFRSSNQVAYELEYEVLFVWLTYIPLVAHPILYFSFCSEFLQGSKVALRKMCGCQQLEQEKEDAKLNGYKEQEIMEARSTVSKTQASEML